MDHERSASLYGLTSAAHPFTGLQAQRIPFQITSAAHPFSNYKRSASLFKSQAQRIPFQITSAAHPFTGSQAQRVIPANTHVLAKCFRETSVNPTASNGLYTLATMAN
jgi:hypothetical protein